LGLQARFDLTDHENAAARRLFDEGLQQFRFLFFAEVGVATPAAARRLADTPPRNETIAQLADPSGRQPQGLGRLFQAQTLAQRQYHSLRLPEWFQAFRRRQYVPHFGNRLFPFEWP
jgi:hypothetical protein